MLRVASCVLRVEVVCCIVCAFDCLCVCLFLPWFVCMLACARSLLLRHYSTSPPSGNQVDGLPLVLHTRAVLLGPPLPSALFWDNSQKLYYETDNYDARALKESEQIKDNTEIMRFY